MSRKNLLRYKGYTAMPEFIAEDAIFYGKILGIDDLVDFYTENSKELELEFHKAVDEYLEFCEEIGKVPQKEYSGTFNVRIAPELHKQISLMAQAEGVSLNKIVERAIGHELDNGVDSRTKNKAYTLPWSLELIKSQFPTAIPRVQTTEKMTQEYTCKMRIQ